MSVALRVSFETCTVSWLPALPLLSACMLAFVLCCATGGSSAAAGGRRVGELLESTPIGIYKL